MKIIPFEQSHIDSVTELEKDCFTIPWTEEMLVAELKSNLAHYFVAEDDGEIIGYAGMWKILDEGHITNIAVSPKYRRKGVGQMLLDRLMDFSNEFKLSKLMLEVRKSNDAARLLYSKNGFVKVGVRKKYYADNDEDAILMNLTL